MTATCCYHCKQIMRVWIFAGWTFIFSNVRRKALSGAIWFGCPQYIYIIYIPRLCNFIPTSGNQNLNNLFEQERKQTWNIGIEQRLASAPRQQTNSDYDRLWCALWSILLMPANAINQIKCPPAAGATMRIYMCYNMGGHTCVRRLF